MCDTRNPDLLRQDFWPPFFARPCRGPETFEAAFYMALYTTQEELEALVSKYRRDLERREFLRRNPGLEGRQCLLQRVPPEVLLAIFSIVLDNNSRNMIFPSHVCRHWRDLVTQSSGLWTYITLGNFDEDEDTVLAYLRTCIQRASPRPLSLSINPDNERMNPDALLEAVFNVAGKYQWKSISYKSNKIAEFIPFFDGRFNLGQVRSLSLTCVDREEQGIFELDLPGGVVDMRPFTHLRSLNLNFEEEINITKVLVPWGQLTDLKLTSSIDSRLCLSILRHCINLETCELHPKTYKDRKIEKYKQPVRLPQLKQLRIIASSDIPAMLVDNLQCPALQDASFHYDYDEERNYSFLLSFIENCRETLLKLELPGLITDEFIEMQGHLNVLEELTITGRFGWPETFEDLMDGRADRPYDAGMRAFFQDLKRRPETLPKLKVLRILDQRPEEKSSVGREVAQFIESRLANCKDSAPLHIVFRLNKDASEEQRKLGQKYRKWRAQGFTMDFE